MKTIDNKFIECIFNDLFGTLPSDNDFKWALAETLNKIVSAFPNDMRIVAPETGVNFNLTQVPTESTSIIVIDDLIDDGIGYFFTIGVYSDKYPQSATSAYSSYSTNYYFLHGYVKNNELFPFGNKLAMYSYRLFSDKYSSTINRYLTITKLGERNFVISFINGMVYVGKDIIGVYPGNVFNGVVKKDINAIGRYAGFVAFDKTNNKVFSSEYGSDVIYKSSSVSSSITTAKAQYNKLLLDCIVPVSNSSDSENPKDRTVGENKPVIDTTINGMYLGLAIDDLSRANCRIITIANKTYLITPSNMITILPGVFIYDEGYEPIL